MDKQEIASKYLDFLSQEGFRPSVDEDGDVTFRYEGGFYGILIDPKDVKYVRLVFPNFWSIDSKDEGDRASRACVYATGKTKVAKVYTVRDNVWAAIELFCPSTEAFQAVFPRCMGALRASVSNFREYMTLGDEAQAWQEIAPDAAPGGPHEPGLESGPSDGDDTGGGADDASHEDPPREGRSPDGTDRGEPGPAGPEGTDGAGPTQG